MRGWETGAMTTSFPVFAAGPLNQVITMAPSSRFGSRVNMFVFIFVYLYIYLPVYMRVSAALHECLFVCLFVFVSIFCLSVRLPVCLFAYLSICISLLLPKMSKRNSIMTCVHLFYICGHSYSQLHLKYVATARLYEALWLHYD